MEEEKILGVIPKVSLRRSLFKVENFNLVVTDKRIIAAKFTKEIYKKEANKRAKEAKEKGHGRFKQFLSSAGTSFTFYKRYLDMPLEEILGETAGTFTVEPSNVKDIRLKEGRSSVDEDGSENKNPNTLLIVTSNSKLKFNFNSDINNARRLLMELFKRRF